MSKLEKLEQENVFEILDILTSSETSHVNTYHLAQYIQEIKEKVNEIIAEMPGRDV